jgi:hypothetical protein
MLLTTLSKLWINFSRLSSFALLYTGRGTTDVELCDCFIEYGGVTAEMLLLFTFVILGASLIWTGFSEVSIPTLAFAAFSVLIRVPVYLLTLIGSNVDRRGRLLIAWYGPSGLSSLLLVLVAVFAGLPGSDRIFAICSFIVLISIVIHGASPRFLQRIAGHHPPAPEEPPVTETPTESGSLPVSESAAPVGSQSVSLAELDQLQESGQPVIILDVRTDRSRDTSEQQAKGSIRLPPDDVIPQARKLKLPKEAWLIAYCA